MQVARSAQRYEIIQNIRGLIVHYPKLLKRLNMMHVQIAPYALLTDTAPLTAITVALTCLLALCVPIWAAIASGYVERDSIGNPSRDLFWGERCAEQIVTFASAKPSLIHMLLPTYLFSALLTVAMNWLRIALYHIKGW